jgi:hypothetical protein
MKEAINLKFNCQEDLESMSCSEKGEFCTSCRKEVIDFPKMSYSEIHQVKGDQTEMCGMFLPEQIDPSLRPIELPKVRSLAFLSTILVSLNFGNVLAQSAVDPKIEQAQGASNAPRLTPEEAKVKMERGEHISMSITAPEPENLAIKASPKKAKKTKKWYWSKRFPFVHKKRVTYSKGRFL